MGVKQTSGQNIQIRHVGATVGRGRWDGGEENWKARQKADATL